MIAKDFDQDLIPQHVREEFIAMQERQEVGNQLKEEIETHFREMKDLIEVEVGEKQVAIRLMGETAFDSGKAYMKPQMMPLLIKVAKALEGTSGDVYVAGHTDNVPVIGGPYGSNLKLSIARAAVVAEFLLKRSKLTPSRVATMGFGKYRPLVPNNTNVGRKKNRRVEIILRAPEKALNDS